MNRVTRTLAATWNHASLRTRLLLGILVPTAAFLMLGTWSQYRNALASAHAAFDRKLVSAAYSIADTLRLEESQLSVLVPYAVLELHAPGPSSTLFHRVTDLAGELLSGDVSLPQYRGSVPSTAGYPGLVGLYDDQIKDIAVRVAVVYQPVEGHERAGVVPVQVAEPLSNREVMTHALLWQMLATQLTLLLAVAGVTALVVNQATRPLLRLQRQLEQIEGDTLATTLCEHGVNSELLPVVRALNMLIQRVRSMLDQQQRFVSDAAHQLRTPLAVLQTQLQSGLEGAVDPVVLMREMQGTVHRAAALSQQMLSLARVHQLHSLDGSGRMREESHRGVCALGDATKEAALELSPLIAQRDLAFSLDLPDESDCIAAIHPWLAGELIRNLLHNAIRNAPMSSALGVTLERGPMLASGNRNLRWVVWDHGPGIPFPLRERVFEPFAAASLVAAPKEVGNEFSPLKTTPGSGLGLSICKAIVHSSGGKISLDTHQTGPGLPGLRVTVTLQAATNVAADLKTEPFEEVQRR